MKLFLMRHGEAEPYLKDDASRALTATGRASVASKQTLLPTIDLMVVSPYLRALQTADILVGEGLQVSYRTVDERVTPDCELDPIIDELINPTLKTQLIVAHNPLLSRLVRLLCGNQAQSINLHTADIACLEADDFQPGCAQLLWVR
ncbi:histidine phosphatase family protein [Reinekea sp. G2M2-21]|uniref:SixA phosphatase family protein n=1 Tax=Reinekea sp. G2M2-21 TaxID=2788942 RepID=UPI0018A8D872